MREPPLLVPVPPPSSQRRSATARELLLGWDVLYVIAAALSPETG